MLLHRSVLLSWALLTCCACSPERAEEDPSPELTPSPFPLNVPFWEWTTWDGYYIEQYDEHVSAHTSLYFNIEEQDGLSFNARIYHFFGYIIIDGYEIPPNNSIRLTGQFLGNDQLEIQGQYYGHSLYVLVDYRPDDLIWIAHLDLDDGYYDVDVLMGSSDYVAF